MKNFFFILFTIVLLGCVDQPKDPVEGSLDNKTLYVKFANLQYNLAKEEDRIKAVNFFLGEEKAGKAEILFSAVQKFKPVVGDDFDGLFVQYRIGDEYVQMVVPFDIESSPNGRIYSMAAAGCTMTCNASTFCHGCTITIITKCQSVTCSCSQGAGDCVPVITFPN